MAATEADGLLLESTKKRKVDDTSEEKQQEEAVGSAAATGSTLPALPLRCPPYPKSGKRRDVAEWNRECRRVSVLAAKDPRRSLPTAVKPKDPGTADSLESPHDKALVRAAARSVVSVYSYALDGKVIDKCSGIVISQDVTNKCARILTSSKILGSGYDDDQKPKLQVRSIAKQDSLAGTTLVLQ